MGGWGGEGGGAGGGQEITEKTRTYLIAWNPVLTKRRYDPKTRKTFSLHLLLMSPTLLLLHPGDAWRCASCNLGTTAN